MDSNATLKMTCLRGIMKWKGLLIETGKSPLRDTDSTATSGCKIQPKGRFGLRATGTFRSRGWNKQTSNQSTGRDVLSSEQEYTSKHTKTNLWISTESRGEATRLSSLCRTGVPKSHHATLICNVGSRQCLGRLVGPRFKKLRLAEKQLGGGCELRD